MAADLSRVIKGRWAEYLRFYRGGAIYSGLVRLAEIHHCLAHRAMPEHVVTKWKEALQNLDVTEDEIALVRSEARQRTERLHRIMAVGTDFNEDELLLLITMRVELELLSEFLGQHGIRDLANTEAIDQELAVIAGSRVNASRFRSAQRAARTNWGIPLRSRWLETNVADHAQS